MIPYNTAQVVSWLPFNAVSGAILDIALEPGNRERSLNLVHPRPVPWRKLFEIMSEILADGQSKMALISWAEWLHQLKTAVSTASKKRLKDLVSVLFCFVTTSNPLLASCEATLFL